MNMAEQMTLAERWMAQWPMYKGWMVGAVIGIVVTLVLAWLIMRYLSREDTEGRTWIRRIRFAVIVICLLVLGLNMFKALSINIAEPRTYDRSSIEEQADSVRERTGGN